MPHPAVMTVWAALVAVAKSLPAIALVGSGGTLSVASALLPLCGVFFGPYAGALVAAIGGFIGQLLAPSTAWLGIFTFLIGVVTAFTAGMIIYKRWYISAGVLAIGIIIFECFEMGRKAWLFAVMMYGTGMVALIICGILCANFHWFNPKDPTKNKALNQLKRTVVVFLAAYASQICSGSVAGISQLTLFHMPLITWKVLAFSAPLERVSLAIGATVIGIPLLYALPKVGIFIGEVPSAEEEAALEAEAEAALAQEQDKKEQETR